MHQNKLTKTAKNLDTLVKVVGGIFQAVGIVCLVFAVLIPIAGDAIFMEGSLTLDLDFLKIHVAEQYEEISLLMKIYTVIGLVSAAVLCFTVWYAAKPARKILHPMMEGRPFEAETPANLRKIAWINLIGGGIAQIIGIAERMILTRAYPMEEIFSSPAVEKLEYVFDFDFGFILISIVILFLSYIFSYGQQLQQEADETL